MVGFCGFCWLTSSMSRQKVAVLTKSYWFSWSLRAYSRLGTIVSG
uniref:Uncharacterized protein n=1 Tax=Anguilla anguilla TaxID=7936 RepID=A0A0E9R5R2_ANGAN